MYGTRIMSTTVSADILNWFEMIKYIGITWEFCTCPVLITLQNRYRDSAAMAPVAVQLYTRIDPPWYTIYNIQRDVPIKKVSLSSLMSYAHYNHRVVIPYIYNQAPRWRQFQTRFGLILNNFCSTGVPFTKKLNLIPALIRNHKPSKVWNVITYSFQNFNSRAVDVSERFVIIRPVKYGM